MTTRITVALAAILALAGFSPGQTGDVPNALPHPEPGSVTTYPAGPVLDVPGDLHPGVGPAHGPDGVPLPVGHGEEPVGVPGEFWAGGDFLLGWVGGTHPPPLVTTSPVGTPFTTAGLPVTTGTRILFGDQTVNNDVRTGGHFDLGYWFGGDSRLGVEAAGFYLPNQTVSFQANSTTTPILARPFTDATNMTEVATLVAFPRLSTGSVAASARSGAFYGGTFDLADRICGNDWFCLDFLVGYRYQHYEDDLQISQAVQALATPVTVRGTTTFLANPFTAFVADRFAARNDFNGGEVGFRGNFRWCRWKLEVLTKVAVGRNDRDVEITGYTLTTVPGKAPVLSLGGLLALPSNIGTRPDNSSVFSPEVGVTTSYQVTDMLWLRLGYWALFWAQVDRASDQVDLVINRTQIPPSTAIVGGAPVLPSFLRNRSSLWVQGITFGAEIRY